MLTRNSFFVIDHTIRWIPPTKAESAAKPAPERIAKPSNGGWMSKIADLLFQAKMLKELPRSGFHFLGAGKESVAEHCFCTAFIGLVMTQMESGLEASRLIGMCLVHDLAEARIGDLNTVNKMYVTADEHKALEDSLADLAFGHTLADLVREFNDNQTREAQLARDADQLALVMDLKALADIGYRPPQKWLPPIIDRLQTNTGKQIAEKIMRTDWDGWWLKNTLDRGNRKH
jgi:putative hydrolase of HD superfamily